MELEKVLKQAEATTFENNDGRVDGFFNIVANNYWNMGKEDLAMIAKELDYAISKVVDSESYNEIINVAIDSIKDLNDLH